MITVTNNSVQQINAALLAILREIDLLKNQNKELSNKLESYKNDIANNASSRE